MRPRHRSSVRAMALTAALALAACSRHVEPPPRAEGRGAAPLSATAPPTVDDALLVLPEVMEWVVGPAAGVVFAAAGRHAPTDRRPSDAQAWQAVADAAAQLVEQGTLLAQPALASSRADWLGRATAMRRSAAEVMDAARQHDAERAAQASDALRAACQGCHLRYAAAVAQRVGEVRDRP